MSFNKFLSFYLLKFGGFKGNGGAFFGFEPLLLSRSSEDESKSGWRLLLLPTLRMMSLSLLSEFDALRFFLGGLDGGGTGGRLCLLLVLPLRLPRNDDLVDSIALVIAELLAMLMQPMPFRFFGFRDRLFCGRLREPAIINR